MVCHYVTNVNVSVGFDMVKVATYKAFGNPSATVVDKAVALATFSNYSHTEIVFSDGVSFSVSPRDGGGRFKKIEFDEEHWDIIELPNMTKLGEAMMRAYATTLVGKPYNYLGAIFSITPFCCCIGDKYFCSEAAAYIFKTIDDSIGSPCSTTPSDFREYCIDFKGTHE